MSRTANYDCQYSGSWKADVQVVCTVHLCTLHILQGLQVHKAGQKILVDLTAMRIERSPLCQQQAGGCMVAIEVPYHTVAYHGGAIEVPWGGH